MRPISGREERPLGTLSSIGTGAGMLHLHRLIFGMKEVDIPNLVNCRGILQRGNIPLVFAEVGSADEAANDLAHLGLGHGAPRRGESFCYEHTGPCCIS